MAQEPWHVLLIVLGVNVRNWRALLVHSHNHKLGEMSPSFFPPLRLHFSPVSCAPLAAFAHRSPQVLSSLHFPSAIRHRRGTGVLHLTHRNRMTCLFVLFFLIFALFISSVSLLIRFMGSVKCSQQDCGYI